PEIGNSAGPETSRLAGASRASVAWRQAKQLRTDMKVPFNPTVFSATILAALAAATMTLVPGARAQVRPTHRQEIPNFDKRVRAEPNAAESAQREQGKAYLKAQLPSAEASFDAL